MVTRRKSIPVNVGGVVIGGAAPIAALNIRAKWNGLRQATPASWAAVMSSSRCCAM